MVTDLTTTIRPSQDGLKAWGSLMHDRYDFIKSGVYWYFVVLDE